MGSSPPRLVHAFHPFPIQHLVVNIVRLYFAHHKSMKTSIYVAETVVSDLFIVRTYPQVLSSFTEQVVLPAISVLYRMEREHPHNCMPPRHLQRRRTLNAPPSGTGIAAVYTLSLMVQNTVVDRKQEKLTNSFFTCTLALNTVCTGASRSILHLPTRQSF